MCELYVDVNSAVVRSPVGVQIPVSVISPSGQRAKILIGCYATSHYPHFALKEVQVAMKAHMKFTTLNLTIEGAIRAASVGGIEDWNPSMEIRLMYAWSATRRTHMVKGAGVMRVTRDVERRPVCTPRPINVCERHELVWFLKRDLNGLR